MDHNEGKWVVLLDLEDLRRYESIEAEFDELKKGHDLDKSKISVDKEEYTNLKKLLAA